MYIRIYVYMYIYMPRNICRNDNCQLFSPLESSGCSLPKLLQFITGAKSMPPVGFSHGITVKFLHGSPVGCKCRPTSSTCDLSITLPVHCSGPEEFNSTRNTCMQQPLARFPNLFSVITVILLVNMPIPF